MEKGYQMRNNMMVGERASLLKVKYVSEKHVRLWVAHIVLQVLEAVVR